MGVEADHGVGFSPKERGSVRLLLGGDLMLGRAIDWVRSIHNHPDFGKPDARHPSVTIAWAEARGCCVQRGPPPWISGAMR